MVTGMNKITCIGIFREQDHSPERESDDEAILAAVARDLSGRRDFDVRTIWPREVKRLRQVPDAVFYMCEEKAVLSQLETLQDRGALLINSLAGVRATFREAMLMRLADVPFFPRTRLVSTGDSLNGLHQVWVKRGDYHAIEKRDVQFAATADDLRQVIGDFARRGIARVLIQQHVPGDLIKFYGVRTPGNGSSRWFHRFYHRDQQLGGYAYDKSELQALCEQAADRLELEIFGGDAIVTARGRIFVIDVNAWPSFALFRKTAAHHIADHIVRRVEKMRHGKEMADAR